MKFTLNIPIDRADWMDENGMIPDQSVPDMQLLLWAAECDYKDFKEFITTLLLDQMVEQLQQTETNEVN